MQVARFTILGSGLGSGLRAGLRAGLGVGLLVLLSSRAAQASNGIHPRTPVVWEPAPACMTVVDRSVEAKLEAARPHPYANDHERDALTAAPVRAPSAYVSQLRSRCKAPTRRASP